MCRCRCVGESEKWSCFKVQSMSVCPSKIKFLGEILLKRKALNRHYSTTVIIIHWVMVMYIGNIVVLNKVNYSCA